MRLATRRTLPQGITALLALTSPFAPPGNAASFQKDVVVRVLDDDKVKLEALGTVQLAGIRTPTRGVPDCYARVPFVRARCCARAGRQDAVDEAAREAHEAAVDRLGAVQRRQRRGEARVAEAREREEAEDGPDEPLAPLRVGGDGDRVDPLMVEDVEQTAVLVER
ncbi:hypothetical protein JL720_537 [Aureococcus anophagefferens]|nr:hypothetical protein JL720_537 [Aureococcus anophagefferens]